MVLPLRRFVFFASTREASDDDAAADAERPTGMWGEIGGSCRDLTDDPRIKRANKDDDEDSD